MKRVYTRTYATPCGQRSLQKHHINLQLERIEQSPIPEPASGRIFSLNIFSFQAFFYRNWSRRASLVCEGSGTCVSVPGSGLSCPGCRMNRCLKAGMSLTGVRACACVCSCCMMHNDMCSGYASCHGLAVLSKSCNRHCMRGGRTCVCVCVCVCVYVCVCLCPSVYLSLSVCLLVCLSVCGHVPS